MPIIQLPDRCGVMLLPDCTLFPHGGLPLYIFEPRYRAMLEEAQPMITAESISHQSYRRLLSRAREYVLENMSEPLTVLDLCQQLHVSRRTLQNAFHAILGIGPNAWLKRIRLNAVRRELISPWSQSTTVKDAAMQWGFWHLGQFATDYQQLFAEKPSLTLHQRMRQWA